MPPDVPGRQQAGENDTKVAEDAVSTANDANACGAPMG